ncbi:MAG: glutaredoxin family protein [Acidobacteria bacterium]|nr:glutaredoxin family protein [Acidobacteriota bacterium]
MSHLTCQFIYNSAQRETPLPSSGFAIDLAHQPQSAHQLIKLGFSPRKDLPIVLLTDAAGKLRVVGLRLSPEEAELLVHGRAFAQGELMLYSATWCPECRRVKQRLAEAEIPYAEVDLDTDVRAEALVIEHSGGRRVVPTLKFDDRLYVFNPDPSLLARLLDSAPPVPALDGNPGGS